MLIDNFKARIKNPSHDKHYRSLSQSLHIDLLLFSFILLLSTTGLLILYSASNQNMRVMQLQGAHLIFAFGIMFLCAQISPAALQRSAPWLYTIGLILLLVV